MKMRLSFNSPSIYPFDKAQGLRHLLPANRGFTIIELLIVIVIIAILAAVTYVSYGGLQNNATVASLQSDLTNASDQLVIDQANSSTGVFPATLAAASGVIKWSGNTTPTYTVNNTNTPKTFCLSAIKSNQTYFITQEGLPMPGPCPVLYLDAGITTSYPGTGTTWTDLSGNGNNGTLNGTTHISANGGSLSFNGNSDYINAGNGASLTITNAITADAWVKTSVNSGIQMIVGKGNDWRVEKVDNNYRFEHRNSSNVIVNSVGIDTSTDWVYVAATYELNTFVKLYINGALVSSQPQTLSTRVSSANNQIGNNYAWHPGGEYNDYFFNGNIANVRIYNRALTATEITQNYNNLKSRYGL